MGRKTVGGDFVKRFEAFEKQSAEEFILRYGSTRKELKETIAFLIRHREMLRDTELERLEAESNKLLKIVRNLEVEMMLEEIRCFKEILSLQKKID